MEARVIIRSARKQAGLSLREAARRAGTSASTLAAYESGKSVPSVATLERVVHAVGGRLEVNLRPMLIDEHSRAMAMERLLKFADQLPLRRSGPLRYPLLVGVVS
jgi:transcriptional regulator with XRE-family HTH domain